MNGLEEKRNAAPGSQPDTAQENTIELSENEIACIEAEAAECEQLQKAFVYSIEADAEKREIAITLPAGQNRLVLPENWAYAFIKQFMNQIREWRSNQ